MSDTHCRHSHKHKHTRTLICTCTIARTQPQMCLYTRTHSHTLYIFGSDPSLSPRVFNCGCWHTYSTCYTLGFQHVSVRSIWDCHWLCTLHYLAGGVFDPSVRADRSPSLMLNLAATRARFHYRITRAHKQAYAHTLGTHRLCPYYDRLCKSP